MGMYIFYCLFYDLYRLPDFPGKKPPAYSLTSMVTQESAAGAERGTDIQ